MKKEYQAPRADKMDFVYSETVTASNGDSYREYVDGEEGCRETPTDNWFVGLVRSEGCRQL